MNTQKNSATPARATLGTTIGGQPIQNNITTAEHTIKVLVQQNERLLEIIHNFALTDTPQPVILIPDLNHGQKLLTEA